MPKINGNSKIPKLAFSDYTPEALAFLKWTLSVASIWRCPIQTIDIRSLHRVVHCRTLNR